MGLEPQLAAPTNYYLVDYYNTEFSLGEAGPPAYIVLKDLDYANPEVSTSVTSIYGLEQGSVLSGWVSFGCPPGPLGCSEHSTST